MKIAVLGATGRIGSKLTRSLLDAGHQVRAMSRGGQALAELTSLGAEPFVGSFDAGTGDLGSFFQDVDAAFLMVKTDWDNVHGHYSEVALRLFDALRRSQVKRAVNLTAMGSEVRGNTGHFQPFHQLDQILNRLDDVDLVHLQAGWFMDDLLGFLGAVVDHGRIAWSLRPDVATPWVGTADIAGFAYEQLLKPAGGHRVTYQLGTDYSMPRIAEIISQAIGRHVDYRFIDRSRKDVEEGFLQQFGSPERWLYDTQTFEALNDGRVHFEDRRPTMPTDMETFVRASFVPRYQQEAARRAAGPRKFYDWMASDELPPA
jgi:uncharacterized protein YbjT (DUF2867 family)